ncbi:hypothetical protein [Mannheimia sp. ZY171111]|uniref:hypothetical protein n=1 Tax=Mannheimia sp. ZY171111 TaxID=2679995 RepID=UPI001ADDA417|nr:hypothetical protein [Mannheimia sp. ZY171111]QTM01926.1 hypothetical protein GM698_10200 [Mannheimia sp. ZY171111]
MESSKDNFWGIIGAIFNLGEALGYKEADMNISSWDDTQEDCIKVTFELGNSGKSLDFVFPRPKE